MLQKTEHNYLQSQQNYGTIDTKPDKERVLWMSFRQALIIILGAIEDYLEMPRSVIPRHKR